MRLTEQASTQVQDALTAQAAPGEAFFHEVLFGLAGRPGGVDPELTIIIVGYSAAGQAVMAPPSTIRSAIATTSAIEGRVATALTWIRSQ